MGKLWLFSQAQNLDVKDLRQSGRAYIYCETASYSRLYMQGLSQAAATQLPAQSTQGSLRAAISKETVNSKLLYIQSMNASLHPWKRCWFTKTKQVWNLCSFLNPSCIRMSSLILTHVTLSTERHISVPFKPTPPGWTRLHPNCSQTKMSR